MKALLISLFTLCLLQSVASELLPDTVLTLEEILVSARRAERFSAGLQHETLAKESLERFPNATLSDFLGSSSPLFIKTYGGGGLASIAMRGAAPQHTAFYWNGLQINPPNIAMTDLSMLPLFLFKRIDMVSGGSSTLHGNGSIAGSIHLSSQNGQQKKHLNMALSLGRYGKRLVALKSDYSIGKLKLSSAAWHHKSRNDFVFVNTTKFDEPEERLSNADEVQTGILQEAVMRFNRHHFRAGFWYQEKEAGIPPSMTMDKSHARQSDRMLRGYFQWNLQKNKFNYSLRSGYTNDYLRYTDTLIGLDSKIQIGVWSTEAEITVQPATGLQLIAGANYRLQHAKADAYPDDMSPADGSVFLMASQEFKDLDWFLTAGARKEFHSDFSNIPPALSLGWQGKLVNTISGRINISSNYRTPTLNDRYWQPGGNPNLKAETSRNFEAGLDYRSKQEKITASITAFNNYIDNWITWLPAPSGYWQPENISTVMIYGLETRANAVIQAGEVKQHLGVSYAFTRSLYNTTSLSDARNKPQLIYTPIHATAATYQMFYKNWAIHYTHKLTGSRYTDRANTTRLPAFHTANLSIARSFTITNVELTLNASVHNLTGHTYQVIAFRPMPGRTFQVSIMADLLFQNHKTTNLNYQ
jgi:vitamin B12 transporter